MDTSHFYCKCRLMSVCYCNLSDYYGQAMNATVKSLGIDRLGLEDRLLLVEEIWDSIGAAGEEVPLTPSQRAELEHRLADDDINPGNTVSWDEIKTAALSRLGK
jgi:putative addiction module component (TIGR02574 family)